MQLGWIFCYYFNSRGLVPCRIKCYPTPFVSASFFGYVLGSMENQRTFLCPSDIFRTKMSRKKLSHVSCSPHFQGGEHILTQMSSFLPTSVSNTQALPQLTMESHILTTSTPRRPGVSSHSPPAVVAWAIR